LVGEQIPRLLELGQRSTGTDTVPENGSALDIRLGRQRRQRVIGLGWVEAFDRHYFFSSIDRFAVPVDAIDMLV
jgi:hypothetical protein